MVNRIYNCDFCQWYQLYYLYLVYFITSCLFFEIVVFYSTQCATGPPTKLMMAKHLEEIDHIYDSYKIILSVIPGMGIGDKGKHFLDPNKTEGPENLSLSTGPTLELCTWSGTSTGTSA